MRTILLECVDCGWRGEYEDCDKEDNILYCPKCGSKELREIGRSYGKLEPVLTPC